MSELIFKNFKYTVSKKRNGDPKLTFSLSINISHLFNQLEGNFSSIDSSKFVSTTIMIDDLAYGVDYYRQFNYIMSRNHKYNIWQEISIGFYSQLIEKYLVAKPSKKNPSIYSLLMDYIKENKIESYQNFLDDDSRLFIKLKKSRLQIKKLLREKFSTIKMSFSLLTLTLDLVNTFSEEWFTNNLHNAKLISIRSKPIKLKNLIITAYRQDKTLEIMKENYFVDLSI